MNEKKKVANQPRKKTAVNNQWTSTHLKSQKDKRKEEMDRVEIKNNPFKNEWIILYTFEQTKYIDKHLRH